ncbi:MAG: PIN domain-containing protein [Acidimicrobiaceae bacterium]|nr:PIN domain-containing protein [Acidimicrobiaceae bacterium]
MLVVDTSVLLAAGNVSDSWHCQCAELLRDEKRLIVPAPVVTETSIMINRRLGAVHETRFLATVATGCFQIVDLEVVDYRRTAELLEIYNDLRLGFVDAAIVAVAERHGVTRIATLNHRDFTVVRPAHAASFILLP